MGDDTITIDGTHRRDAQDAGGNDIRTITTLNTGGGDDTVTVSLDADSDGFFVLNTQDGSDTIDAAASTLPLIIFGGQGEIDKITGGLGDDVIFGDHGRVYYKNASGDIVTELGNGGPGDTTDGIAHTDRLEVPVDLAIGGRDTIIGWDGDDLIFGQSANDLIIGDRGQVLYDATGLNVTQAQTTESVIGGNDEILGGLGDDIILGGTGDDTLYGHAGDDVILGDNGLLDFVYGDDSDATTLDLIRSIDPEVGGVDRIYGNAGSDFIIGGAGGDSIYGDDETGSGGTEDGDDIIIGDNGEIKLSGGQDAMGGAVNGGHDVVDPHPDEDVVFGGVYDGADILAGNEGDDVILGDNGRLDFVYADNAPATLDWISSLTDGLGGADQISGHAGGDIIVGGTGDDVAYGDDESNSSGMEDGADIILGDNGDIFLTDSLGGQILELLIFGSIANIIQTSDEKELTGGSDVIDGSAAGDVILGGVGSDTITAGDGNKIVVGDSGTVLFDALGVIRRVVTGDEQGLTGGDDTIESAAGNHIIIGGVGADTLKAPGGNTIILGDNGEVNLNNTASNDIFTTEPALGGEDTITGGSGDNIIIGGAMGDTIIGGSGDDVILGDSGIIERDGQMTVKKVATINDESGGIDEIDGFSGNDVIMGGAKGDILTALFGDNIILGDAGEANLNNTDSNNIFTTSPEEGGSDTITGGGDGSNIIIGGAEGDHIIGGIGDDVILGDSGSVFRSGGEVVQKVQTGGLGDLNGAIGGSDIIDGGAGSDVILGGAADDTITANLGGKIILGDNGEANLNNADSNNIFTTQPTIGGVDTITGGSDAAGNIIIGGAEGDHIIGGAGNDVILGDGGEVLRDESKVVHTVRTTDDATGGEDHIDGAAGKDVIMGGAEGDILTALFGDNIILGDAGEANLNNTASNDIFTTNPAVGGSDTITGGGDGSNIIIGGALDDRITGGTGNDVILGDGGHVDRDGEMVVRRVRTIDDGTGGVDTIDGYSGDDIILGGAEGDFISAEFGDNIILGDAGEANLDTTDTNDIFSTSPGVGGSDTITGSGAGRNIIIGGAKGDEISGGDGHDVILGDNGSATFDMRTGARLLQYITIISPDIGGDDHIYAGDGDDVILGGMGTDYISIDPVSALPVEMDTGDDIILGDNGLAQFDTATGASQLTRIETDSPENGSDDYIFAGDGDDVVLGGSGADTIDAGTDAGYDVILGDNGLAVFDTVNGILLTIQTSDPDWGGDDTIYARDGADVVLGGSGRDVIDAGTDTGRDIVIGDNGVATFDTAGVLASISTLEPGEGGSDEIVVGDGNDVVFGGIGTDYINIAPNGDYVGTDSGRDVIVGDNGLAVFDTAAGYSRLTRIETSAPEYGDGDFIFAGDGDDVVLGGSCSDTIDAGTDAGYDVVLGDNGLAVFDAVTGILRRIQTSDPDRGSDDRIYTRNGADVVLGGSGSDYIDAGTDTGRDIVVGDNGQALFTIEGILYEIRTMVPEPGGEDEIGLGDGGNEVLISNGIGYIKIARNGEYVGTDCGKHLIMRDNGFALFDIVTGSSLLTRIETFAPDYNSDDFIFAGDGDDVVLGGSGADTIDAGTDAGCDVILGDNGFAKFDPVTGILKKIQTADPTKLSQVVDYGAADEIYARNGDDVVFGGSGDDVIDAGTDTGRDIVVGDNGVATFDTAGVLASISTLEPGEGGSDEIVVGDGDDVVFGGYGTDHINIDPDTLDAAAGSEADTGADVILGDNGSAVFDTSTGASVLDSITTTSPGIGCDDYIYAADGADVVLGGVGTDYINMRIDGSGSPETIGTDSGDDVIVGDNGYADFTPAGIKAILTKIETSDPAHGSGDYIFAADGNDVVLGGSGADSIDAGTDAGYDVILGDNGFAEFDPVTGILKKIQTADPTKLSQVVDYGAADEIYARNGDDVVFGGSGDDVIDAGTDTGRDIVVGDNGVATFDAAGVLASIGTLEPGEGGSDEIVVGDGDDVVFGGYGTDYINIDPDTLTETDDDSGADVIVGDNGSATFVTNTGASVLDYVATSDPGIGGDDYIYSADGDDVLFGGVGTDFINMRLDTSGDPVVIGVDSGEDVIVGDNGYADFTPAGGETVLTKIETSDPAHGSGDYIFAADGNDVVLGGSGADTIDAGTDAGYDVILGDNGFAEFDAVTGILQKIQTADPTELTSELVDYGAADTIFARNGDDVVFGGSGSDCIDAGTDTGRDIVVGDNGQALFTIAGVLYEVRTTVPDTGGDDEIIVGDGDDVVFGGIGTDYINIDLDGDYVGTDSGNDVIVGDNGFAIFDTATGSSCLTRIETDSPEYGDGDYIFAGDGDDVVLGGSCADTIDAGTDAGYDVVLGDNGSAVFDAATGILLTIQTSDPLWGCDDTIYTRNGADVVLGGSGSDYIDAGTDTGRDIVVGDNGEALFTIAGVLYEVRTTVPDTGGDDEIIVGDGDDVVFGGYCTDYINIDLKGDYVGSDSGADVIVGDNGLALFDATTGTSLLTQIETSDPGNGCDDFIFAGNGDDVVLGGSGSDTIDAGTDAGYDVILGDNGLAVFDAATSILRTIQTSYPDYGGDDTIFVRDGDDVVLGGSGSDYIDAGTDTGRDIVVGDNGQALFTIDGVLYEVRTTVPDTGGEDEIVVCDGDDVVFDGIGTDYINIDRNGDYVGTDSGADVIVGDNGFALFDTVTGSSLLTRIGTAAPEYGDGDFIFAGDGDDVVLGGSGSDIIDAGTDNGRDIVVGDNGQVLFTAEGVLYEIRTTVPDTGGEDEIVVGDGDDVVFGGIGTDYINIDRSGDYIGTDSGNDVIVGDNGFAQFDTATGSSLLTRIETAAPESGDGDFIFAGDGDDVVLGGSDADFIDAGTDAGYDVILGDNGLAVFDAATGILRTIQTSDPGWGGDDTIYTRYGADVVLGGSGNDLILAGGDDATADVVVGDNGMATYSSAGVLIEIHTTSPEQGGKDIITTGNGPDVVLGGNARDIILASANDASASAFLALLGTDYQITPALVADLITTGAGDNAKDVVLGDNGQALFVESVLAEIETTSPEHGDDDIISAGNGPDVVMGGSAADLVLAGGDDAAPDIVIGDNGKAHFSDDFVLETIFSWSPEYGGNDIITTGNGPDVVIGGSEMDIVLAAAGDAAAIAFLDLLGTAWTITPALVADLRATGAGDDGRDVLIGDSGRATFLAGSLVEIETIAPEYGDTDIINAGNGPDVVFGGTGDDVILAGDDGAPDQVIGDNGRMTFGGAETFDPDEGSATISFNFNGPVAVPGVDGEAGAPGAAADYWNNLAGSGSGIFGTAPGDWVLFDDGTPAAGVSIAWGTIRSDGSAGNGHFDTHSQHNAAGDPDSDLFAGYLYGYIHETLEVRISGLAEMFAAYDVYVYLDADDYKSASGTSVRRISDGTTDYFLDDPDGNTFDGAYLLADATDPTAAGLGNYVVFRGLSDNTAAIRVDDDTTAGTSWHNRPTITGVQVVGTRLAVDRFESTDPEYAGDDFIITGGGADMVVGGGGDDILETCGPAVNGYNDADLVAGDNARVTLVAGDVRDFTTIYPTSGGNDTILTGSGADIVLGGTGADAINSTVQGDYDNGDVTVISLNFSTGTAESRVTGVAGLVQAANWNNLRGPLPYCSQPGTASDIIFSDGTATDGVSVVWGRSLGGSHPLRAFTDNHDQLGPDSQNDRIFEGYLTSHPYHTIGVDISGLGDHFTTYDAYVYLDADNGKSSSGQSVRRITDGLTTFYLDDADGNTFAGEFIEVTAAAAADAATGNYVVFRNLSADAVSLRVDGGTAGTNRPAVSGIQIVGGDDKDNLPRGGDVDDDIVLGDNGKVRILNGWVYRIETTEHADVADGDDIHTGIGRDLVFGGNGADMIDSGAGDDVIFGDNASLDVFDDARRVIGITLLSDATGGNDQLIGGLDDDLLYGQFGDDTYIFTGGLLGDDVVFEAGDHDPYGRFNDLHDRLDFSDFNAAIDIDLETIRTQVFGGDPASGDDELALTLSTSTGVEAVIGTMFDDTIEGNSRDNQVYGGAGNDIISGEIGDDHISGGEGDDHIYSDGGDDTIAGNDGDDRIWAGSGYDVITGDDGNDYIDAGSGDDRVSGGYDGDEIYGRDGDDVIDGDEGHDRIWGEDGNDLITGGSGDDDIYGGRGDDVLYGAADDDDIYGGCGDDEIYGGAGDDYLRGDNDDDTIYGGSGDDRIDGDSGDDLLAGEAGNDRIEGGSGEDLLFFPGALTGVEVTITHCGYGTSMDGLGGTDELRSSIDGAIGTEYDDVLIGDDSRTEFHGMGGDDELYGRGGDDLLYGGAGEDIIRGDRGDDVIEGGSGNDDIDAGRDDDRVLWKAGDGDDTVDFDDGWDRLVVTLDDSADTVTLSSPSKNWITIDGIGSAAWSLSLYKGDIIEIHTGDGHDTVNVGDLDCTDINDVILYLGDGNDRVDGAEATETIKAYGEGGSDWFIGGSDDDTFDGGSGIDTLDYSAAWKRVKVDLKCKAYEDGRGSRDYLDDIENLIGTAHDDDIWGTDEGNLIYAGAGHDEVWTRRGDDTVYGESGNDKIYGDDDVDTLYGGEGHDRIYGGSDSDFIDGGDGHDYLKGDSGNDEIYGRAGDDDIYGGSGNDTLYGATGDDYIRGDSGHDTVYGDLGEDRIYGDSGDDVLYGAADDDDIYGGCGDDEIYGGAGDDYLRGDNDDDTIYGGSGDDRIDGDSGDDLLAGEAGNDRIEGGSGEDLLFFPGALTGVEVTITHCGYGTSTDGLGGTDELRSSIDGAIGTEYDDVLIGDDSRTEFHGLGGNDVLDGRGGDDLLVGNDEDDRILGCSGHDTIIGGLGADWIDGGSSDDLIYGGGGDDTIFGDSGDDQIVWIDTGGRAVIDAGSGHHDHIFINTGSDGDHLEVYLTPDLTTGVGRMNVVPFLLSLADAEIVLINTDGGDDVIWVYGQYFPGVETLYIDMGAGTDTYVGSRPLAPESGTRIELEHIPHHHHHQGYFWEHLDDDDDWDHHGWQHGHYDDDDWDDDEDDDDWDDDDWDHHGWRHDHDDDDDWDDDEDDDDWDDDDDCDDDHHHGSHQSNVEYIIDGPDRDYAVAGYTYPLPQPPDDSPEPLAYWNFDETAGNIVHDMTGEPQNAVVFGNVDLNAPGAVTSHCTGTSADFHGKNNEYMAMNHDSAFELDNGTIQFWFQTDSTKCDQTLFSKDHSGYRSGGHIDISLDGSRLEVRLQSTNKSYYIKTSKLISKYTWYHLAFTFGDDGMHLYLNGNEVGSNCYTGGLTGNREATVIGGSLKYNCDDSGDLSRLDVYRSFNGRIDEVAIFDQAMTAQQILALVMLGPLYV